MADLAENIRGQLEVGHGVVGVGRGRLHQGCAVGKAGRDSGVRRAIGVCEQLHEIGTGIGEAEPGHGGATGH